MRQQCVCVSLYIFFRTFLCKYWRSCMHGRSYCLYLENNKESAGIQYRGIKHLGFSYTFILRGVLNTPLSNMKYFLTPDQILFPVLYFCYLPFAFSYFCFFRIFILSYIHFRLTSAFFFFGFLQTCNHNRFIKNHHIFVFEYINS